MGDPRPINPPFSRIRFGVAAPLPAEGVAPAFRPVSFSSTSLKIVHILRAPTQFLPNMRRGEPLVPTGDSERITR